jgi:ferredoxin
MRVKQIYKLIHLKNKMPIKINDDCIGCGTCSAICEEVFEMDGPKAKVLKQIDTPCVDEAIESCIVQAISK